MIHHLNYSDWSNLHSSCGVSIVRDKDQYNGKKENRKKITTSVSEITCVRCLREHLIRELFKIDKIESRIKELNGNN